VRLTGALDQNEAAEGALPLAAASLQPRHDITRGRPEPAPAWLQVSAILPWLDRACQACAQPPHHAVKASEWLLDNEFHVRRAVRQVREDVPIAFYRRLPRLAAPEFRGIPRIMAVAHGMLDAEHLHVSLAGATSFIKAYQQDGALTIAELWAFPAFLRLACLEALVLAFAALLPDLAAPFEATPGLAAYDVVDPTEGVSRAISALIAVSNTSWKAFVEAVSRVEALLRTDPAGVYPAMDFDTRDRYRRAVEEIADGARAPEWEIAAAALQLARAHAGTRRRGHVGCWLVAEGRPELERSAGFRAAPAAALRRWILAHPGASYAASLAGFSGAALGLPALLLALLHAGAAAWVAGIFLSLTPASIIGVTLTHWLVTQIAPPRVLPKLDVDLGLAAGQEAALVMPVILRQQAEVAPLIDRLERHWLSNPDPLIQMALLTDLADAEAERMPSDAPIEAALVAGIRRLNARYAPQAPFVLLHRARRWNPAEGCWMGWERKRGKLEEFASFILGHLPDAFSLREGNVSALSHARFVVTFDADTTAQPGGINRLLGVLAHPLNRVEFHPVSGRPRFGYTFIQPRVEILPSAGNGSLFTRLYTGDTAIDIYSRAVSDVYQDLFGEGIFTGKGAFDVAAFHQFLHGRVPDNAIVSHDLFEGLHGRSALASDIVLYEDFPASYIGYARRAHRWIRGDWQLLPWLARSAPVRGGGHARNELSVIDRWKILDNLRRSLIPPAMVAFAAAGWLALPGEAWIWTALTVAAPGAYLVTDLVTSLAHGRRRGAAQSIMRRLADHSGRWLLAIVFLAYEAAAATDAIVRTLWRIQVSHRRLLEWTSAAHSAAEISNRRRLTFGEMAASPLLAVTIALVLAAVDRAALPGAAPLLLLWFAAPEIALRTSRPRRKLVDSLAPDDRVYLRRVARRTWLFFETFAGPDDNWLPPDNYQASPYEEIAHRTSPTNIGMLFLSSLTACDFGHAGVRELDIRAAAALNALDRMENYAGHTLNWYNTQTLKPLEPRYVSTVDSGNLAVCLLTLSEGCREAVRGPVMSPALWNGLEDALGLLRDAVAALSEVDSTIILDRLDDIVESVPAIRNDSAKWRSALIDITADSWRELKTLISNGLNQPRNYDQLHEIHLWMERADHHLANMRRDLEALLPWQALAQSPPAGLPGVQDFIDALPQPDGGLETIIGLRDHMLATLRALVAGDAASQAWVTDMAAALGRGAAACLRLRDSLEDAAQRASARAFGMDFRPLYDAETKPSSLATISVRIGLTSTIMTCWRARRGWQAISPLPSATCLSSTGSTLGG
jgi:cyclic beta-1,2-glucan synthetase